MDASSIVRLGIIGLGNIGTAHAVSIYSGNIQGAKLAAICDISQNRLKYAEENFDGVTLFENYHDLMVSGLCDAVIVATPHKLHTEIAESALSSGLHVLVEKPVDIAVSRAKRINEIAQKSDRLFAIMFNQRTSPMFKRLREIVKSGQLGAIKSINWIITNWYRTQYYYDSSSWRATWCGEGGGVLMNQSVHNLDIWQWIFGMPDEITAFCDQARYHNIEVEDSAVIYARYKNGATGIFSTSTGECPGTNRLEVCGELGKIVVEGGKLKWWRLKESERKICFEEKESFVEPPFDYEEYIPTERETAHVGVITAFVQKILGSGELIANGCEGINELMISNAAYLSTWLGNKPVSLPIDADEYDRHLLDHMKASPDKNGGSDETHTGYSSRWSVNW